VPPNVGAKANQILANDTLLKIEKKAQKRSRALAREKHNEIEAMVNMALYA